MGVSTSVVLAILALICAGMAGCAGPAGAYGAREFIRINDTHGLPTYKASGRADDWLLDASRQAHDVMNRACPDGNPQLIDGMGGMTFDNFTDKGWWWATFTCDHAIALPPSS